MYHLYKKTDITDKNPYGIELLEDELNPFIDNACILYILALNDSEKHSNGSMNQIMELLGFRTNHNENSGVPLSEFKGTILSLAYAEKLHPNGSSIKSVGKFKRMYPTKEDTEEFVQKYFYPLISEKNMRISSEKAKKRIRNVNILSYCDGTRVVKDIEHGLVLKMEELGYSEDEISSIISQLCIFPFADGVIDGNEQATCISFKDINDPDCRESIGRPKIKQAFKEQIKDGDGNVILFKSSPNESVYIVSSNGEHFSKRYTSEDLTLSLAMSSVITRAVKNSIENNSKQNQFSPVTTEYLTKDVPMIMQDIREKKDLNVTKEEILSKIGKNLKSTKNLAQAIAKVPTKETTQAAEFLNSITNGKQKEGDEHSD